MLTPDSSQTESDVSPVVTRRKKLSVDLPTLSVQTDDTSPRVHKVKGKFRHNPKGANIQSKIEISINDNAKISCKCGW